MANEKTLMNCEIIYVEGNSHCIREWIYQSATESEGNENQEKQICDLTARSNTAVCVPSNPYVLTPLCRVLLEQLTGLQLVKKFPRISRNPKVHYRPHKRPPPVSILGQPNAIHIPTSHLLQIRPNISQIKPAQCCIKLVFYLTYTMMHGSTKLKSS